MHSTDVARRLRALRNTTPQTEFARSVGLAQTTVSRMERGLCSPRATTVQLLAGATGASADWILTGRGRTTARARAWLRRDGGGS